MAIITEENCYVTLDDATAYFDTRVNSSNWFDLSVKDQERALITATRIINSLNFVGSVVSQDQPLAFPRTGEYFDASKGMIIEFTDIVPERVLNAVYELAIHLVVNNEILEETGSVEELRVGSIMIKNIRNPAKTNDTVKNLLKPLLNNASGMWWRAN